MVMVARMVPLNKLDLGTEEAALFTALAAVGDAG
jgi:hypothetical protein